MGLTTQKAEITELLDRCRQGDRAAQGEVFERLYPELRRIAASKLASGRPQSEVTPTVLVNEAYVRLVSGARLDVSSRRHFFTSAAQAMRHILIDQARRVSAEKRGGRERRVTWTEGLAAGFAESLTVDLDRALDSLAEVDPRAHRIVELRFFAGLSVEEVAELLEISVATVYRSWQQARAFLHAKVSP